MILNRILLTAAAALFARPISAGLIFESATLGPTCVASPPCGAGIYDYQYLASRFEIERTRHITTIGGGLQGTGTYFAALFPLPGADALLEGNPFAAEPLAVALLNRQTYLSSDVIGHVNLTLHPGWYAIVIGRGRFGADSNPGGGMPTGTPLVSGAFFFWTRRSTIQDELTAGMITAGVSWGVCAG